MRETDQMVDSLGYTVSRKKKKSLGNCILKKKKIVLVMREKPFCLGCRVSTRKLMVNSLSTPTSRETKSEPIHSLWEEMNT